MGGTGQGTARRIGLKRPCRARHALWWVNGTSVDYFIAIGGGGGISASCGGGGGIFASCGGGARIACVFPWRTRWVGSTRVGLDATFRRDVFKVSGRARRTCGLFGSRTSYFGVRARRALAMLDALP